MSPSTFWKARVLLQRACFLCFRTAFRADRLEYSAYLTRSMSISLHEWAECELIISPRREWTLRIVDSKPSLKMATARQSASSFSCGEVYCSFGAILQRRWWSDSLGFWVFPSLHASNWAGSAKLSKIGNNCSYRASLKGFLIGTCSEPPVAMSLRVM